MIQKILTLLESVEKPVFGEGEEKLKKKSRLFIKLNFSTINRLINSFSTENKAEC